LGGLPHNGDSRKKINSSLLYLTFPLGSAIMDTAPRKALRPQKMEAELGTSPRDVVVCCSVCPFLLSQQLPPVEEYAG
jgi:hypothetical protein